MHYGGLDGRGANVKDERMKNIVYPYTCPYFIPVPGDDYKCERMTYHYSYDKPDTMKIGCFLGRKIYMIQLDLDDPKHPRTADEFFDGLYLDATEEERKSIEIHIRRFFERKLIEQKGGNGG